MMKIHVSESAKIEWVSLSCEFILNAVIKENAEQNEQQLENGSLKTRCHI